MRFKFRNFGLLSVFIVLAFTTASASDESMDNGLEFENKAHEAHQRASSDMMYQNEEWKALYYQNESIIGLLKQIRDSLEAIRLRDGLDDTENKKP